VNKATKIFLKSVSTIIVALIVVFAFLLVGVRVFDVKIYSVLSGSMEPTYKVGSLIYVKEVKPDDLNEKDPITFQLTDNTIATHRIVDIQEDEKGNRLFQTKGDANLKVDERLVEESEIIGKPFFTIPLLGYVAHFMQTQYGLYITLGVAISLIIIVMIIDSIVDDKKKKEQETN